MASIKRCKRLRNNGAKLVPRKNAEVKLFRKHTHNYRFIIYFHTKAKVGTFDMIANSAVRDCANNHGGKTTAHVQQLKMANIFNLITQNKHMAIYSLDITNKT